MHYIYRPSPTVVAYFVFIANADARKLREAMTRLGSSEIIVIDILANRTNLQRQKIAKEYKTLYGMDLSIDLTFGLIGNFGYLITAMMMPLPQYYAKELHDSMRGSAIDDRLLIEVLCTLSNDEIKMVKQAYTSKYSRILEYDISGDTTDSFKGLMVPLFIADRDESFDLDPAEAQEDARALIRIVTGDLSFGSEESTFLKILAERSFTQLQQIFIYYESMAGHGIEKVIENQYSGDIKDGLLSVVKCLRNSPVFFAEQFYKTVQGPEIDDKELIRLIVTRSEIDMRAIKEAFVELYDESLENYISEDCYGCYKECLITLIS